MYMYDILHSFSRQSPSSLVLQTTQTQSCSYARPSMYIYLPLRRPPIHSLTHSPTHSHDIPSISHIPDHLTPTQLLLLQFASSFFLLSFSSQAKQTNFSHIFFISLSCFWVDIIGHRCAFLLPNVPFLLVFVCLFAFIRLPFEKFIIIYFHYFLDNSQTKIHLSLYKYVI